MTMTTSKHVIVGGLGNLGRHMQEILLSHGKAVSVIDRCKSKAIIDERIKDPSSVEYVPHSLGVDDPTHLQAALRGADTVYSMVTPHVLNGTVSDFHATNAVGLQKLVNACREVGVPKLVYVSSIAVTNLFTPSVEQNEDEPLPDIKTYATAYERTKRIGEDTVLETNCDNFQTCSIRAGSLLSGPDDYIFQSRLERPGRVYTFGGQPMDSIPARDYCKALFLASNRLDENQSGVAGKALFVTKCRDGSTPTVDDLAEKMADYLGWPVTRIPTSVMALAQRGLEAKYTLENMFYSKDDESRIGLPLHKTLDISNYQHSAIHWQGVYYSLNLKKLGKKLLSRLSTSTGYVRAIMAFLVGVELRSNNKLIIHCLT